MVPRPLRRRAARARRRLRVRGAGVPRRARCARRGGARRRRPREADVPGLRSVVADVRTLPFDDGSFDFALCISTLEHVGRDNEVYDVDAPREDSGDEAALRELHRVLDKDGRLLVSVPTGVADDQGWQVVRDAARTGSRGSSAPASSSTRTSSTCAATTAGAPRRSRRRARRAYREHGAGAVLLAELRPGSLGGKVRLAVRDVRHARRHPSQHPVVGGSRRTRGRRARAAQAGR